MGGKHLNVDMRFTADTSQAKSAINELQSAIQKLGYGSASQSIGVLDPQKFKEASANARELAMHLNNAFNIKTGNLDLSKLSSSLKASGTSLTQLTASFKDAGSTGQQAFTALAKSIAMADQPALTVNEHLSTMFTTLKNVARFQLSSSIMHGLIGGVQTALNYSQDLNESLNNIRIVTGQSIEQMNKFAQQANKNAKSLNATTLDYTKASLIYYQQGLDDKQVAERTAATLKLANVSRQSAEAVSDQMTAIWNNFDNGSRSLESYIDVITALGASTASSSQEIATGLSKFSAVANTIGLSYEYATSALATLVAETRQSADQVGTSLRTIFSRLQGLSLGETLEDGTTLNKYSQALKTIGVDIQTQTGELKDMDTILEEMASKWQGLSKAQQVALAETVGGVRQYTNLVALMDKWDVFKNNLNTANNSGGALQAQADIYAESWEAARDRVKTATEGLYQNLLDDKMFISVDNGIEKLISGINKFIESMGGIKPIIDGIMASILMAVSGKIGPAFQKVVQDIKILTGGSKKVYGDMQKQFGVVTKDALNSPNFKNDPALQAELKGYSKLLEARTRYSTMSNKLSDQERMKAQLVLQGIERQGENYVEATRKRVQAEEDARVAEKNKDQKETAYKAAKDKALEREQNLRAQKEQAAKEKLDKLEEQRQQKETDKINAQNALRANRRSLQYSNNARDKSAPSIKLQTAYNGRLSNLTEEQQAQMTASMTKAQTNLASNILKNSDFWNGKDANISLTKGRVGSLFTDLFGKNGENVNESNLETAKNQIKTIQESFNGIISKAPQLKEAFSGMKDIKSVEGFQKQLALIRSKLGETVQLTTQEQGDLLKSLGLDPNKVDAVIAKLEEIKALEEEISTVTQKRDAAQKEYDEAAAAVGEDISEEELLKNDNVKKAKEKLDEAQGKLDEANNRKAEAEKAEQEAEQELNEGPNSLDLEHKVSPIEAIASTAAALGQVAMAVNTVKSAIDTLGDSEAGVTEKTTALLMAISMGVPAAASAFGALKNVVGLFNTTLAESNPVILAIMAAIAAAVIGFQALQASINADNIAAQNAANSATQMAEAYDKAKASADGLRSAIDGYSSAIETLNSCIRGTKEWDNALQQVQTSVSNIVDALGNNLSTEELRQLINDYKKTGSLNEDLLEQAQKAADNRADSMKLNAAQADYTASQRTFNNQWDNLSTTIWGYSDNNTMVDDTVILNNFEMLYEAAKISADDLEQALNQLGFTFENFDAPIEQWQTQIVTMGDNAGKAAAKLNLIAGIMIDQLLGDQYSDAEKGLAQHDSQQAYNESYYQWLANLSGARQTDKATGKTYNNQGIEVQPGVFKDFDWVNGSGSDEYKALVSQLQAIDNNWGAATGNVIQGWDGNNRNFKLTYNGDEVTRTADFLAQILAGAKQLETLTGSAESAKAWKEGFGSSQNQSAVDAIGAFYDGTTGKLNTNGLLSQLTQSQLAEISSGNFKSLGFDNQLTSDQFYAILEKFGASSDDFGTALKIKQSDFKNIYGNVNADYQKLIRARDRTIDDFVRESAEQDRNKFLEQHKGGQQFLDWQNTGKLDDFSAELQLNLAQTLNNLDKIFIDKGQENLLEGFLKQLDPNSANFQDQISKLSHFSSEIWKKLFDFNSSEDLVNLSIEELIAKLQEVADSDPVVIRTKLEDVANATKDFKANMTGKEWQGFLGKYGSTLGLESAADQADFMNLSYEEQQDKIRQAGYDQIQNAQNEYNNNEQLIDRLGTIIEHNVTELPTVMKAGFSDTQLELIKNGNAQQVLDELRQSQALLGADIKNAIENYTKTIEKDNIGKLGAASGAIQGNMSPAQWEEYLGTYGEVLGFKNHEGKYVEGGGRAAADFISGTSFSRQQYLADQFTQYKQEETQKKGAWDNLLERENAFGIDEQGIANFENALERLAETGAKTKDEIDKIKLDLNAADAEGKMAIIQQLLEEGAVASAEIASNLAAGAAAFEGIADTIDKMHMAMSDFDQNMSASEMLQYIKDYGDLVGLKDSEGKYNWDQMQKMMSMSETELAEYFREALKESIPKAEEELAKRQAQLEADEKRAAEINDKGGSAEDVAWAQEFLRAGGGRDAEIATILEKQRNIDQAKGQTWERQLDPILSRMESAFQEFTSDTDKAKWAREHGKDFGLIDENGIPTDLYSKFIAANFEQAQNMLQSIGEKEYQQNQTELGTAYQDVEKYSHARAAAMAQYGNEHPEKSYEEIVADLENGENLSEEVKAILESVGADSFQEINNQLAEAISKAEQLMAILKGSADTFNDPTQNIQNEIDSIDQLASDLHEDMTSDDWTKFKQDSEGLVDWGENGNPKFSDFMDMDYEDQQDIVNGLYDTPFEQAEDQMTYYDNQADALERLVELQERKNELDKESATYAEDRAAIDEEMEDVSGELGDEYSGLADFSDDPEEQAEQVEAVRDAIDEASEAANRFEAEGTRAFKEGLPDETDWNAVKEVADYLMDIGGALNELSALGMAELFVEQADAVEYLSNNFESLNKEYKDLNKKGKKTLDDFNRQDKILTDLTKQLQKYTKSSAKWTKGMAKQALESGKLEKALQGDSRAFAELQAMGARAITQMDGKMTDFQKSFQGDMDAMESAMADSIERINKMVQDMHIAPGKDIMDADIANVKDALEQYLNEFATTTDEAEQLAAQMGWDIEAVQEDPVPDTEGQDDQQLWDEDPQPYGVDGQQIFYDVKPGGMATAEETKSYVAPPPAIKIKSGKYSGGGNTSSSPAGGGGGGGGGGKPQAPKPHKKEDMAKRYHRVKQRMEDTQRKQDEASRNKERSFGAEKIHQLEKEIDLRKQSLALQQEYTREIAEKLPQDLQKMREALGNNGFFNIGIEIDDDGVIKNYDEVEKKLLDMENQIIDIENQFRVTGAEMPDALKIYLEMWQQAIDDAREYIDRYEETLNLFEEQMNKVREMMDEISDAFFEKIQTTVDMKIEINDDDMALLEYYLTKYEDDAYKAAKAIGLFGDKVQDLFSKISIYNQGIEDWLGQELGGNRFRGMTMDDLDHLTDPEVLRKIMYGDFTQEQIEAIREWRDGLLEANEALLEIKQNIVDKVNDAFDSFNERIESSYEKFDVYNTVLETFKDITDLMGQQINRDQLKLISQLNDTMLESSKIQLETAKDRYNALQESYAMAQAAYNNAIANGDEDMAHKWEETLQSTQEALNDAHEEYYDRWQETSDLIQEIFETMMENIVAEFDKAMSGAFGSLEYLQDAFDRISDKDTHYLEDYDTLYELNKLQREINKLLTDTRGVTNRQEILELQKQITEYQEKGADLSQYEVDALRAKFELQQAYNDLQLAEEAKQTVRLQRDMDGNWGYVFTANEDEVAEAEQEYEDKLHEYQKLNTEYIQTLQEKALEAQTTYKDMLQEIMTDVTLTDDERQARIEEINAWLQQQMSFFEQQSEAVFDNQAGTLQRMLDAYKASNAELIDSWSETLLSQLTGIDDFDSYLLHWAESSQDYQEKLQEALNQRTHMFQDVLEVTGTSIGGFSDTVNTAMSAILDSTHQTQDEITTLADVLNNNFGSAIQAAIAWQNEFSDSIANTVAETEHLVENINQLIYILTQVRSFNPAKQTEEDFFNSVIAAITGNGSWSDVQKAFQHYYDATKYSGTDTTFTPYDTGGYTGSWGSEGKLAILHEKENVFNAEDTENLLDAATILRKIDLSTDLMSGGIGQLQIPDLSDMDITVQQEININAEFPDATDREEIEEAFDNLANRAIQYINRKDE